MGNLVLEKQKEQITKKSFDKCKSLLIKNYQKLILYRLKIIEDI